jgi:hypothetical protein
MIFQIAPEVFRHGNDLGWRSDRFDYPKARRLENQSLEGGIRNHSFRQMFGERASADIPLANEQNRGGNGIHFVMLDSGAFEESIFIFQIFFQCRDHQRTRQFPET